VAVRPAENPVRELGVLLTRRCNASCAHCGSSSGPHRAGSIDPAVAVDAVRGAASAGVASVILTGGEPFLVRPLLATVVAAAASAGMRVAACSNGWWGGDRARARSWLAEVREAGLGSLLLSTDRWHLDHVSVEAVIGAARVAGDLGIAVQVAVPAGRNDWVALGLVARLRAETDAGVYTHPAHPVGRGADLGPGVLQVRPAAVGPCHLVGHLEVGVDGTFTICPTSAEFAPSSPLRLGNVATEDAAALVERYRRTPLYWVLAHHGPAGVARLARLAGTVTLPAGTRHDCVLCEAVHRDRAAVAAISGRLGLDLHTPQWPDVFAFTVERAEALLAGEGRRHLAVRA